MQNHKSSLAFCRRLKEIDYANQYVTWRKNCETLCLDCKKTSIGADVMNVPSKRRYLSLYLHGVTCQNHHRENLRYQYNTDCVTFHSVAQPTSC